MDLCAGKGCADAFAYAQRTSAAARPSGSGSGVGGGDIRSFLKSGAGDSSAASGPAPQGGLAAGTSASSAGASRSSAPLGEGSGRGHPVWPSADPNRGRGWEVSRERSQEALKRERTPLVVSGGKNVVGGSVSDSNNGHTVVGSCGIAAGVGSSQAGQVQRGGSGSMSDPKLCQAAPKRQKGVNEIRGYFS